MLTDSDSIVKIQIVFKWYIQMFYIENAIQWIAFWSDAATDN